jgi:protease I
MSISVSSFIFNQTRRKGKKTAEDQENHNPDYFVISNKEDLNEIKMQLRDKKIAILVANGVEDLEFYVPFMRLEEEGADVIAAAAELKTCHGKHGLEITPTATFDSLRSEDLFALVIPGGWAPDKMRRSEDVKRLVKEMDSQDKIIGIICHGGLVAISAGIVKGCRATGSEGIKDDIINAGATWVDEAAFRDGHLVWGRVVADLPAFCRELVLALKESAENGN